ncbi:MAG: hypothetical protein NTX53_08615 [candidate division WOR-3 bacterium]|nr:hypothetical protein [candidate division WOR-3 bacterium]
MTAARTAGVCLVLAGIALAGPQFRIGTKLTWHGGESYSDLYDTAGTPIARVVYERFSVGPAVEASYGPVLGMLTGRLDLAQVSLFTSGGAGFSLFPMLGLDVMAEPPTQWRVKPYVWAGVRTAGYTQSSSVYEFHPDAAAHWRGGLGVKFTLNSRIDLFAETQLYQRDNWWDGVDYLDGGAWMVGSSMTEVVGLVNAGIGARFALGK